MVQLASTFLQFVENPDIKWQGCWANISPPPFKIIERNAKRKNDGSTHPFQYIFLFPLTSKLISDTNGTCSTKLKWSLNPLTQSPN